MTAINVAEREQRMRPFSVAAAAVAGVLLLVAAVLETVGPQTSISELTLALITVDKRAGYDIASGILNVFGAAATAGALVFLFNATRARNPRVAGFIPVLVIVGAVLAAVSRLVYAVVISQKAHTFVTSGTQTYVQAHRLMSAGAIMGLGIVIELAALLVALSFVLVSMQAMRVGLLTKLMGYLGMFAGALVIFPIIPLPVVEAYWLVALAVLFAGRWPSGQPAAWSTGRAEAWPSGAAMREQRVRAASGGAKKSGGDGTSTKTGEVVATSNGTAQPTGKRKRKRKR